MALDAQDVVEFIEKQVAQRVQNALRDEQARPWTNTKRWALGGGLLSVVGYMVVLFTWCDSAIDSRVKEAVKSDAKEIAKEAAAPAWSVAAEQVKNALAAATQADVAVQDAQKSQVIAAQARDDAKESARAAADAVSEKLEEVVADKVKEEGPLHDAIINRAESRLAQLEQRLHLEPINLNQLDGSGHYRINARDGMIPILVPLYAGGNGILSANKHRPLIGVDSKGSFKVMNLGGLHSAYVLWVKHPGQ